MRQQLIVWMQSVENICVILAGLAGLVWVGLLLQGGRTDVVDHAGRGCVITCPRLCECFWWRILVRCNRRWRWGWAGGIEVGRGGCRGCCHG